MEGFIFNESFIFGEGKKTMRHEDKTPGEVYQERIRYLLSADSMIEEMLNKVESREKRVNKTGWVCCGTLIRTDNALGPRMGEQFCICDENRRKLFENTTLLQVI